MVRLENHAHTCISALVASAILTLAAGVSHAEVLFEERFDDPGFSQWIIHGDGVSNVGGVAQIIHGYWWDDGLESVPDFDRPVARDGLVVEGWFKMDAGNPRCGSRVALQSSWGGWDSAYSIGFFKDHSEPGDHEVTFKVWIDGGELVDVGIGQFEPGEWIGWMLCLKTVGCEAWLNYGGGWVHEYTESLGSFQPVAINLLGCHDTSGGAPNTSYWDDILVCSEIWCPVSESSWSSIKGLYR